MFICESFHWAGGICVLVTMLYEHNNILRCNALKFLATIKLLHSQYLFPITYKLNMLHREGLFSTYYKLGTSQQTIHVTFNITVK